MGDQMLRGLTDERERLVGSIETVRTAAFEQGRDLSEQDKNTIDLAKARVGEIDGQLNYVAETFELNDEIRNRLARTHPGEMSPVHHYRSVGEIVYDAAHRANDRDARSRYDRMMTRAAQHMGTVAADTTATAGDLAGFVVDPVVGPLVQFNDVSRPLISAIGPINVPAYDFRRPYIVDASIGTGTTAQTAQKAELPSTAFTVASDTLEYSTYGEYLNVSEQLLSFQPSSLQTIINELAGRVARGTEKAAFNELDNSTSKVTLSLTAVDAATVLAALWDAIALVYAETGSPATWLLMGPTGQARLGKVSDSAGRPLFPALGPANAIGTADAGGMGNVLGLRPIVSYAVTTAALWMGNSRAFEVYEHPFPLMQQAEPSVLGVQVAIASACAFYRPRTATGQKGPVQLGP